MQELGEHLFKFTQYNTVEIGNNTKITPGQLPSAFSSTATTYGQKFLQRQIASINSANYKDIWKCLKENHNEFGSNFYHFSKKKMQKFLVDHSVMISEHQISYFLKKMRNIGLIKLIDKSKGNYQFLDAVSYFT